MKIRYACLLAVPALALFGCSSPQAPARPAVTVTAPAAGPASPEPVSPEPASTPALTDGTYLVGEDLKAGSYRTPGPGSTDILDSCYWEIATDDSESIDSIVGNDNLTGPGRLTVRSGQYLKLSGGCEWSRA